MNNLIGYSLKEALNILEESNKIINIKKLIGTNKKFNELDKPYVIREQYKNNCVTLYISYY